MTKGELLVRLNEPTCGSMEQLRLAVAGLDSQAVELRGGRIQRKAAKVAGGSPAKVQKTRAGASPSALGFAALNAAVETATTGHGKMAAKPRRGGKAGRGKGRGKGSGRGKGRGGRASHDDTSSQESPSEDEWV